MGSCTESQRPDLTVRSLAGSRAYAPKRAARIDLASLERAGAEQVGEALVRRYPDMIWTARTRRPGGRALILLEFQSTRDRLMALRMAVYQLLGPPGAGMDLPQAILALERDRSAEGTRATVEALRRIAERTGTAYDRFMGGCVAEMLTFHGHPGLATPRS